MPAVKRSGALVGLIALGALVAFLGANAAGAVLTGTTPHTSPARSHEPALESSTASIVPHAAAPSESSALPQSPKGPITRMAIVPVTSFRATATSTNAAELATVLAGTAPRYKALEVVKRDSAAILKAIGLSKPADPDRLVIVANARRLARDLSDHRDRIAVIRADDVTSAVRALAWGKTALFGERRVAKLADWPLAANLRSFSDPYLPGYDPEAAWTLVAGGDILLDRGVAKTVKIDGRGVDFPFSGGSAEILSRYCCSSFGWDLPRTRRDGGEGAVRRLLRDADLAIANFENPAPDAFRYHTSGTIFSADPHLIDGLKHAGIDYVSLANNHIRDAGAQGILDTIANLDARGIAHSGAGRDLKAARKPAIFDRGGIKVAILGYDTIARYYRATSTRAGSAQLSASVVRKDVAAARRAGADLVIVFPHWGTEYDPTPFAGQQRLARACIDAGADLVIGNHAHWAGAVEVYKGKPIWYALGNFVFDQTWSEPTMEGITLELTFDGSTLVQVRMRPHIILDKAQPNFMDPAGSGRVVMGQVFDASKGLLPW
jgi:hypothetical protein